MSKKAIIYWSQTGNTEKMAKALQEASGADLFFLSEISPDQALTYDVLALGCPAMGSEVLEEGEFEPFFTELEGKLSGKDIFLFGSYDWGDGQWMRDWQDRVLAAGAKLINNEGYICNLEPDDIALADLATIGRSL